ncbi:hypothetical protein [Rhodococcus sp. 2G]|uniref:hypothetical protein n=1 Tax=Rhodococcus sp. 2G TaxID=1570939 RepID=UPI0012EB66E0|nr:hypothetical protein [Rhodococcus sp. 2G]
MATMEDLRAQAEKIQTSFARALDEIRADRMLSDEGKKSRIRDLYVSSKAQMDKLKAQTTQDETNRITTLQRRLFGTVGASAQDVIAQRDANDRAEALSSEEEALAMMRSAITFKDLMLERAILRRAFEAGAELNPLNGRPQHWFDVINAYVDEHPTTEDDLRELLDLTKAAANPGRSFGQAMTTWLAKPSELADEWSL